MAEGGPSETQFQRDIRPLLSRHCYECHGPARQEAGLRLDDPAVIGQAQESGQVAIVAGQPEASQLLARVSASDPDQRMPPADRPGLNPVQIEQLRQWIAAGAPWQQHWAYRAPRRPQPPAVSDTAWPSNAIDQFVLARLEATGRQPSPAADPATLLRRVTLDLVGLPPTPAEVEEFLADPSPAAYQRVVDRLLASEQYGVRQALVWLDLARYADSNGYPHDAPRTIWPYRNWVISALNQDLPFDQFTLWQLAGDLLPDPSDEQLIATGFHRNTRINTEAGVDPEEFRVEAVLDRVNTTATVWLGSTLACAQCHDHKYDPFTQSDYYRLLAYFDNCADETTRDESGRITDCSPRHAFFTAEQLQERAQWQTERATAPDAALQAELDKKLASQQPIRSLVMQDRPQPREHYVYLRGSFLNRGPGVTAGVPEVLAQQVPPPVGDNRLSLAQWLVDPRNPLTARVLVNRVWAQYFGAPLAASVDDFGVQTAEPLYVELLDWLASEVVARGWSQKQLHRLIVTSATYQQSSAVTDLVWQQDPENRWLARQARLRLPAELIRDNALAIGGILDRELGGPSSYAATQRADAPELGKRYRRAVFSTWKRQALDDTLANFDAPSRDVACTARTRTNTPLQALNLLNERAFVDAARGLALRLLTEGDPADEARCRLAFRLALARDPRGDELKLLTSLVQRRRQAFTERPNLADELLQTGSVSPHESIDRGEWAAWTLAANVVLNLAETSTRE